VARGAPHPAPTRRSSDLVHIRMGSGVYAAALRPRADPKPADEAEGPFELLQARAVVECAIAADAASAARPNHIGHLDDILARMRSESTRLNSSHVKISYA